jgi:hypothetical protein
MVEVTLLIPITDNDGRLFAPAHHQAWERYLITHFGGFSLLPGTVVGAWSDGKVVFNDQSRAYLIAVEGLIANADKLRIAIRFATSHYRQKTLFVRYLGAAEVI